MNLLKAKRIRHFLRLTYPVQVVATDRGFRGCYPDLPGCELEDDALPSLYARLELARREWLTRQVVDDAAVPLPNSHLTAEPPAETTTPGTPQPLSQETSSAT